ncbi:HipA domain-containing protein [Sanguibacter hominis ATCC BAA-789]|uniref:HipA domain-containing protein n=1 Tax=Sanguibacter hominis ATCC BAA-789 TaxID=1312740 RepID=A0A9X5FBN1_9MICO|nr:HipA domain-containing protein [Sanguibacter hominis ATCC BAA-789]
MRTPERRLTRVGERSVLVLRRFDRSPAGDCVGYISAMTATASSDGEHRDYDAEREIRLMAESTEPRLEAVTGAV